MDLSVTSILYFCTLHSDKFFSNDIPVVTQGVDNPGAEVFGDVTDRPSMYFSVYQY